MRGKWVSHSPKNITVKSDVSIPKYTQTIYCSWFSYNAFKTLVLRFSIRFFI